MAAGQDTLSSQTGVKEGDLLAGKYRIDKILGAGGMGVVVAAHHVQLDDRVAIKFLLPAALGNEEAVKRFAREARAAVKIKSEHVVRVSDVGTLETGAPYMVMEYLEGGDLGAWIQNKGALPVDQAVDFVLQACEAIAEAHAIGIVHRDLKPANLFVVRRSDNTNCVKVLDFGISKVSGLSASGADLGMTKTTAVMGSPLYMSPEQMQSAKNADSRSDIWALGVILYELVTGTTPFTGETMAELVVQILTLPSKPLRSLRPDAPTGFEPVILKCLEKDRGKRYQTVGELAHALVEFGPKRGRASVERISGILHAAGFSQSALALPPSSDMTPPPATGTMAAWGQTSPGTIGGKRAILGVAAVVVVTAVVTAAVVGRKSDDASSAAASAAAAPARAEPAPPVAEPTPAVAPAAPAAAPVAPPVAAAPPSATTDVAAPTAAPPSAAAKKTSAKAAPAPPAKPAAPAPAKPAPAAPAKYGAFDDRK